MILITNFIYRHFRLTSGRHTPAMCRFAGIFTENNNKLKVTITKFQQKNHHVKHFFSILSTCRKLFTTLCK